MAMRHDIDPSRLTAWFNDGEMFSAGLGRSGHSYVVGLSVTEYPPYVVAVAIAHFLRPIYHNCCNWPLRPNKLQ